MAKEDWEEWIEPWNWTVRAANFTSNGTQHTCSKPSHILDSFLIDNMTDLGGFLAGVALTICAALFSGPLVEDYYRWIAFAGGIGSWLVWFGSNLLTAKTIRDVQGYEGVPFGDLTMLLCTRPNLYMVFSGLGLMIRYFEDGRMSTMLPFVENPQGSQAYKIRQYFAKVALTYATTGTLVQIMAAVYLFRTTNAGKLKNFYHNSSLTPYWRGASAQMMYSSALVWVILLLPTLGLLIGLGYFMGEKMQLETFRQDHASSERVRKMVEDKLKEEAKVIQARRREITARQEKLAEEIKLADEIQARHREQERRQQELDNPVIANSWFWARVLGARQLLFSPLYSRVDHQREELAQSEASISEEQRVADEEVMNVIFRQQKLKNINNWVLATQPEKLDQHISRRNNVAISVIVLGVLSYILQWLFWAGFLESMGDR